MSAHISGSGIDTSVTVITRFGAKSSSSDSKILKKIPEQASEKDLLKHGLDVYMKAKALAPDEPIHSKRMKTFFKGVSQLTSEMSDHNPLPQEWVNTIRDKFHQLTYKRGDTIAEKLIRDEHHKEGHVLPTLNDPKLFSYMLSTFAAIHGEISKIPKPDGVKHPKAVIIGSGPYPQSAISLALNGWHTKAVDILNQATERSVELVSKYPDKVKNNIEFVTNDGSEVDYKGADLVIVAAMVHPKDKVIEQIRKTADPERVKVVLRTSSQEGTSLLYERFTIEDAKKLGLSPVMKLNYYPGHDISSYLFKFDKD
jgi:hypothetical protein